MSSGRGLSAIFSKLWINWPLWGGMLAMLLLAKHSWLLFAPAERAVPGSTDTALQVQSVQTGQLFGVASTREVASALDGIRPVGIFALGEHGFAIMLSGERQIGVTVGAEVAPGIVLAETHADHVILERNGMRHRVELGKPPPAAASTIAPGRGMMAPSSGGLPPNLLTPAQQAIPQQQSNLRRRAP